MKVLGVIPARFFSERFPGKVLVKLAGKPVIQHVWEKARACRRIERLVVATDDERIRNVVNSFAGEALLTSPLHKSGTDRIAEVAEKIDCEVVINIQADEPFIDPRSIDELTRFLEENPGVPVASLMTPFKDKAELANPNAVKVAVDKNGFALSFSRIAAKGKGRSLFKHIGLYGYKKQFLLKFRRLPQGKLEKKERLEQLRVLENGYRIKMLETPYDTIGIDTPEDLQRAEEHLKKR